MATLKIGYNLFAASSQAGTFDGTPGNIQVETVTSEVHKLRVMAGGKYWNSATEEFQVGKPAEKLEITVPGQSPEGTSAGVTRLMFKPSAEMIAAIGDNAPTFTVYESEGNPDAAANATTSATIVLPAKIFK